MTNLHKLLGINKKYVIVVSIPASEYFNFCRALEHKGYKTPHESYIVSYNFLFIRHNYRTITKCDYIPSDTHFDIYTHAIPHTTILQCFTPNTLKRIH